MANVYAVARSCTVMYYQDDASQLHRNRIRRGNKFFTAGMKGERIDKRTGRQESDEEDDAGDDTIRGSLLSKMVIEQTINMRTSLDNFAINNDSRSTLKIISPNQNIDMRLFCKILR